MTVDDVGGRTGAVVTLGSGCRDARRRGNTIDEQSDALSHGSATPPSRDAHMNRLQGLFKLKVKGFNIVSGLGTGARFVVPAVVLYALDEEEFWLHLLRLVVPRPTAARLTTFTAPDWSLAVDALVVHWT